ncbi:hypothetical protein JCM10207_002409 [Rhodosporidiobolus poonsookiae]
MNTHAGPSSQPFTRSRTALFLSYRSTRTTPYTPYIDDDDEDAAENTGLMADLEDGRGGRRASTLSLAGRGRRGGAGAGGAKLPPVWVDLADRVDETIERVRPKIAQLDKLHAKHLLPGFKDRSAEEREIEALATSITSDFRTCQSAIRRIAEQSKSLLASRPANAVEAEAKRIDLIMAANVQTALATKVQELSTTFRKKQAEYLRQLKGNESRAAERTAQDPLASLADDESYSRSVLSPATPSLAQQQLFSPSSSTTAVEQRDAEIHAIAQSIADLADLFKDLSSLVIDQGTLLDRIDYNVEQMSTEVRGAVEELKTATRYQRRSGKCQLIFLLLLLIAGCLIIIAYKPRRWPGSSPSIPSSPPSGSTSGSTEETATNEEIAQELSQELNGRRQETKCVFLLVWAYCTTTMASTLSSSLASAAAAIGLSSPTPAPPPAEHLESKVDVLIIGAGPAGCMAADTLARFTERGVTVRVLDKRSAKLDNGQADGLNSRTLEVFESLGFVESIEKEGSRMSEINFWNPCPDTGRLVRTAKIPDTIPGLSRFQQTILHQGRVEAHLLEDAAKASKGAIAVERNMLPESLEIDESLVDDLSAYPITVKVRHLTDDEANPDGYKGDQSATGTKSGLFRSSLLSAAEEEALYKKGEKPARIETIKARFLVGCDGAHSWTRRQLGISMIGEQTDYVWGVLDMIPLTNFPDIRMRCAIHSANAGSVMVIPQEKDNVRLYTQLPIQVKPGERLPKERVTPESILEVARRILHPYTLDTDHVDWFTGYHIGQRLTESFGKHNRVFLAGDACHTHSPKAGQGMNTSMQDTWNLGWKLGSVATGIAKPELLSTYSAERQVVAKTLIDFDTKFSKLFSGKPAAADDLDEGVDLKEFKDVFATGNLFAAGMSIDYADSIVVGKEGESGSAVKSKQSLASKLPVGQRFFGAQVVNQASATADILTTRIPYTGAFRLLVFAGDVATEKGKERLQKLADYLDGPESVVSKYTPGDLRRDSVISVVTIHAANRTDVELYDFPQPSIFHPHNYKIIYVDGPSHHRGDGKAYEAYGISKDEGALVVVRPDQYVGLVTSLDDTSALDAYFAQFLLPAKNGGFPGSKVPKVLPPDWTNVARQEISKTLAVKEVAAV